MLRWLVAAFVAFGLWLVVHAAGAAEPPKICGPVITGEIDPPNDPRQTGRITQGFPAGACGKPVTAPPSVTAGAYGYEAHAFKNRTEQTCINVTLTLTSASGALSAAGYVSSFDPANITAGFAGGTAKAVWSNESKQSFSFDAPVLSDFVVVVSEVADGGGGQYRLEVAGCGDVLVRQVEPNYGPARGTVVTLRGAGFHADAKVAFGGVAATNVTVEDEFTLKATTPAYAGGGTSPHAVDVSVTNGDGTSTTKAGAFSYYEPQPTTIALAADAAPSRFGQLVTFTAHVGPDTPQFGSGTLEFLQDGTVFGTATLDAKGNAIASLSELDVGRHAIVARYGGDDYHVAQEVTVNHEVVRADTATSLTSSKDPASPEESFTLMATVAATAPGAGKPSGSVTFKRGTTDLGTVDLDADGRASFTVSPLAAGDYSFTASFSGNASFNASTSPVHVQHVKYTQTGVSLTVSPPAPVAFGTVVTLDAVVTVTGGAIPKGNVTFEDVTTATPTLLGKGVLDAMGRASLQTSALLAGARSIRVTFDDPDKVFESASTTLVYKVDKAATTVTLTSSKNPAPQNGWVTFTAKVAALAGGAAVKGVVEFRQDGQVLGTVVVGSNGTAAIDSRRLLKSQYTIVAEYKESESFTGSKAQLVLAVGNGVADAGPDSGGGYDGGKRDAGQGTPINYYELSDDGCGCQSSGAPASGLTLVGASAIALVLVRRRRRS